MENMINKEEIKNIVEKLEKEYEFGLTERQVKNIAKKLEEYKFDSKEEKVLALEYSSRIKNEISNYITFNVHNYNLKKYYYCNTIDYAINRVLSVIYGEDIDHIYNDSNLEDNIKTLESFLILEKSKTLSLKLNK